MKNMPKKKTSLKTINTKLNKILKYEKEQKSADRKQSKSDKEMDEDLEQIKKDLKKSPLKRITTRDVGKALIGSFVGVTSHFVFLEGAHFAEGLSMLRAILLLIVAYVVGLIFIYATGYRKVKQIKLLSFVPARITVIYFVAIAVIYFVLYIYGITAHATWDLIFRQVAAVSIPAIIGASAADLIGGH